MRLRDGQEGVEQGLVRGHQFLGEVGQPDEAQLVPGNRGKTRDACPTQRKAAAVDVPHPEVVVALDFEPEPLDQPHEGGVGGLPVLRGGARNPPVVLPLVAHQQHVAGAQGQQPGLVEIAHGARVEEPRKPALGPRSLYLHLPFCVSKCPYCDFNSHVGQQHLMNGYIRALVQEVSAWGEALGHPELDTVFIGGGTPSLVPAGHIARLLDGVREAFSLAKGAEVSLEANPQSAEAEKMGAWLDAGVNRLSLGVQSLDTGALRFLERAHDATEARAVMAMAAAAGFRSVSFDLIFAVPGLSTERWTGVLQEALSFSPDHISAYELTPEQGTRLGVDVEAGRTVLPGDDQRIAQYEVADRLLRAAGYRRYEVSNWARPGHRCRHNMTYWSGLPYAAAGAGAHAFTHVPSVTGWTGPVPPDALSLRQWNVASPAGYIAAVRSQGHAVTGSEALDLATTASDLMMMGLRLDEGVDLDGMEASFPGLRGLIAATLRRLIDQQLLLEVGGRVRATPRGRAVLNRVVGEFLPSTAAVG